MTEIEMLKPFATSAAADLGFPKIAVLGTPCVITDFESLSHRLHAWVSAERPALSVDFTNVHIVTLRRHEAGFAEVTADVDAFVPDSKILQRAMRALGGHKAEQLYGPQFMADFLKASPAPMTHYFLGGTDQLLQQLLAKAIQQQPNLEVVGSHHGYLAESGADDAAVVEEINALAPDFIWVGMGTPRQQAWIHRNKPLIRRGVLMAVGFAFDVLAGVKKDAPTWMQRAGLTWFFRLLQEPARLGPRYFKYNLLFLRYFIPQILRTRFAARKAAL